MFLFFAMVAFNTDNILASEYEYTDMPHGKPMIMGDCKQTDTVLLQQSTNSQPVFNNNKAIERAKEIKEEDEMKDLYKKRCCVGVCCAPPTGVYVAGAVIGGAPGIAMMIGSGFYCALGCFGAAICSNRDSTANSSKQKFYTAVVSKDGTFESELKS